MLNQSVLKKKMRCVCMLCLIHNNAIWLTRVLEALTRKFKLSADVSLEVLAKTCPVTFTGADMYALCADAWMQAVKRKVRDP